jgi:hypothetical protein
MNNRNANITLIFILFFLGVAMCRRWQEPQKKEALNRSPQATTFSPKAQCQMQCMGLDTKSIEALFDKGIILFNQSSRNKKPCPVFTIQGMVIKGKTIRMRIEQCDTQTIIHDMYAVDNEGKECLCD